MGMPGGPELIIILLIVLVLFGAKKVPELMKGMGSGIRNFKKELNKEDEEAAATAENEKIDNKDKEQSTTTAATESAEAKKEA